MTVIEESNLNFERTCRLCVKESADLNPICHSENPLHDLIKECVDIVVRVEDKLPKHVCEECLDRINSWKSFKTSCRKSEDFLCSYVNKLDGSVSSNENEPDKPNSQSGSHSIKIAKCSAEEEKPCSAEGDESSPAKNAEVICDETNQKEDENHLSDDEVIECDDRDGSSTDSADTVERIDITKDKPPKKETSPVIRLANAEAFKLLIDAQFLDTNRNLYRSLDSENYFACAPNRVVDGQNCLLLELEKNVFCEVEFVVDGKSVSGVGTSEKKEEENETVEVETILTEPDGGALNLNLNGTDGVSYIIIPSENESGSTVVSEDSNSAKENKKDANASILHSILKSKGDSTSKGASSKGALMFHKYARPAAEKAVKFVIPGSSPNSGSNVSFVTPPGLTPLGYLAIPPNIQLVNQSNVITQKGLKRSFSEPDATPSRRQKILLPAPNKPTILKPKQRSAISRILEPMVVVPVSKPSKKSSKPGVPTMSSNEKKKFGSELKTADDISQRIQQIIEANEQILQKTWGQYRKEEEEEEEEEDVDEPESIPDSIQLHSVSSGARFILQPIQNQDDKAALKPKVNVCTQSPEVVKLASKPFPIRTSTPLVAVPTPIATAPLPKLPIPRLPIAPKPEPPKRSERAPKSPATKTSAKTIDDILFEGLNMGKATEDAEVNEADESTAEEIDVPIIKYTITEEGLKEPIFILDSSSKVDWKARVPDDQKLDPATLPKNNQRSKILQKFYLPKEPVLTDGATSYVLSEEEDVKDVLFWADQLPDPTKDDDCNESNQNGEIAQMAKMAGIKLRRKRKRKPQKKKPKPKIYTCQLCEGIAYAKFYELTQHDKWFHSDLPANEYCPTCGKCFIFEDRVRWHSNIYHSVKTMFCDLCGRGFSNKERLSTHKKLHSDKYICDQCGYRAPTSRKLDEHYRRHTGEKPFMCDICGMKLASKVSVKQHLAKHTAENPENKWQCPDCEYSSASATSFYHHRKRHETISTFLCEQCGQNVLTKSRLYKHMRFAHGPETVGHYECGECNGIFHSKTACDDHLKEKHRMSGEGRSFVCKLCFKSYATKAACKKHFRTHNF